MLQGKNAIRFRGYLEEDDEFPEKLKKLIDAYDEAVWKCHVTARHAASDGMDES